MAYTYSQLNISDDILLGPIVQPADITYSNLQTDMQPQCLRTLTNVSFSAVLRKHEDRIRRKRLAGNSGSADPYMDDDDDGISFAAWKAAVHEIYLAPVDVPTNVPFTWNRHTEADILKRNPNLFAQSTTATTFILPTSEVVGDTPGVDRRPFPIVAWTLIGPSTIAPFTPANRNYSFVESTPLATGVMGSRNSVSFTKLDNTASSKTVTIGGLVESFTFGDCCAAVNTMPAAAPTFDVLVPSADSSLCLCSDVQRQQQHQLITSAVDSTADSNSSYFFDIATAISLSSYASGCYQASLPNPFILAATARLPYWSPILSEVTQANIPRTRQLRSQPVVDTNAAVGAAKSMDFMNGDGGGLQFLNLVSLVQRLTD
jgi:hypothetical protein